MKILISTILILLTIGCATAAKFEVGQCFKYPHNPYYNGRITKVRAFIYEYTWYDDSGNIGQSSLRIDALDWIVKRIECK